MHARTIRVLGCLVLAWPALASADARVVVGNFKGPNAKQVRSAVVDVLEEHGVELVPPQKAKAIARSSGAELGTESGRVRVAKKLHLQAFIEGGAHTAKRHLRVTVTVFAGADGQQASQFTSATSKAALARDIKARLWAAIGGAIDAVEPTAEIAEAAEPERPARPNAPAPSPAKATPVAPAARDDETPPGVVAQPQVAPAEAQESTLAEYAELGEQSADLPSPLDLGIGARLGTRAFGYNESLPGLRGYSLGFSPSLALRAHWYPAAHFDDGVLANVGLDVRGELLVGVSSKNSAGQKFATNSHAFGLGLRARVPLGRVELGAVAGFGQHAFGLAANGKIDPDIPDVTYNFVRLGVDGRWQFARPLALQLGVAYLAGLSQGEIAGRAWFPHTKGNGFEAEVGLAIPISRMLAFELAFAMQRYFLSLNPEPKDPGVVGTGRVAGGALDQYWSTRLGIVLRL
jgi:hypothetical protein